MPSRARTPAFPVSPPLARRPVPGRGPSAPRCARAEEVRGWGRGSAVWHAAALLWLPGSQVRAALPRTLAPPTPGRPARTRTPSPSPQVPWEAGLRPQRGHFYSLTLALAFVTCLPVRSPAHLPLVPAGLGHPFILPPATGLQIRARSPRTPCPELTPLHPPPGPAPPPCLVSGHQ